MKSCKLHNSHFVAYTCLCSLFFLEQWKCWKNKLNYFYFISLHVFFMGYFPPGLAFYRVRKGKGTIPYSYPSLSFYVIIFSRSGWLVPGRSINKKGYDGALGHLCFLLLSFCIWSNFWVEWEACLLGLSACLPAYLVTDLTVLPCTQAGLAEFSRTVGPPEFCAHRHPECYVQVGRQRMDVPLSSAHVRAPPSHQTLLTKHSSKDKIVRNFKGAITEH